MLKRPGALSVAIHRGSADAASKPDAEAKLSIVSLGESDCVSAPTEISAAAASLFISPDGHTGFIHHEQEEGQREATLDVVDLGTLRIRQTIRLGSSEFSHPEGLISNRDGSELQHQQDAVYRQATYGIAARPDGKQIIVFIGMQEDGC